MILADKIIRLRKVSGWSQEELAEKMGVSRQAVSKWEGAQSVPDLAKILQLSQLFGVTTDYLLKDEIEEAENIDTAEPAAGRRVTMEMANEFLAIKERTSVRIAIGVALCICSPIALLFLGGLYEDGILFSENAVGGIGLIVLLAMVACAVGIFVHSGFKESPYEFIEKEPFETEYGVEGMVRERKQLYRSTYTRSNILGVCLCIVSPVPIFLGAFSSDDVLTLYMVCVTLLIIAVAVQRFVLVGVRWEAMEMLLKEGEFSEKYKRENRVRSAVAPVYWVFTIAVFLAWSFVSGDWGRTWIVWPIAGVLFFAVMAVCELFEKKDR